MRQQRRFAPPYVWVLGSLASLFFLASYGLQAVSEGFTTGRIVRLVFWALFLVASLTLLRRARGLARQEGGDPGADEG